MDFPTLLECSSRKNVTALRQLLIETGLNGGFMALVPKKGRARGNNNYISISCVGSVYKLVAKYLAMRMRKVIRMVISMSQNEFVGLYILGAATIVDECVNASL